MSASTKTVTFTVNKEQSVAKTNGGTNAGSGGDSHAPIGLYNGWRWRELIRASLSFGTPPAGGWQFIDCELWVKTTGETHVNVDPSNSPRISVARLDTDFTMGGGGENSWGFGGSYTIWGGPAITGSLYDMPSHTTAEQTVVKHDISSAFHQLCPATMLREGSTSVYCAGETNRGHRLMSYDEDAGSRVTEFYSMRGSYAPRYVVRYKEGVVPPAPTLTAPSGNVSAAPTSFTATALETPCSKYEVQVGVNADFSAPLLWIAADQTTGISGAAITAAYAGSAQPLGTPIYWRMRTANDLGVYGPWSDGISYTIVTAGAGVITYPVADGLARISNLFEEVEWTTGGLHAKPEITWRFNDSLNREATSIVVKLYDNVSGTALFTDTVTGPFTANKDYDLATTHPVVRSTLMRIEVIPYVGAVAQTSSGLRRFKCQWGQGIYTCAPGLSASGHRFTWTDVTGTDARVAFLHRFRGGTTGAWKTLISAAGAVQANWDILVRLGTRTGNPTLPDMRAWWTVGTATPPDQWVLAPASGSGTYGLDADFRRFGVKSLHVISALSLVGSLSPKPDPNQVGVIVSGDTEYTLSYYVNTQGKTLARKVHAAIYDPGGALIYDPGYSDPDGGTDNSSAHREGWQRCWFTFTTPPGQERVNVRFFFGGAAVDEFWMDAPQLEEGSYASPWTPGLLGPQVILDKGGFQVDASKGGLFRLKGKNGGIRDVIELYQAGLRYANDTEVSSPSTGVMAVNAVPISLNTHTHAPYVPPVTAGAAFPGSPAVNDVFYRTDLRLEFFWDGTRWLSTTLYEREMRNNETAGSRIQPWAATATSAMRMGLPNTAIWLERIYTPFFVSSGGTALAAGHAWAMDYVQDPAATSIGSQTINSGASATWRVVDTVINAVIAATQFEVGLNLTMTGTPGQLRAFPTFYYRRIAT